jgi:hypothetical protein
MYRRLVPQIFFIFLCKTEDILKLHLYEYDNVQYIGQHTAGLANLNPQEGLNPRGHWDRQVHKIGGLINDTECFIISATFILLSSLMCHDNIHLLFCWNCSLP